MNRLFYINITFSCNNNCLYCISHNTNKRGEKIKALELLKLTDYSFNFSANDKIIISGGEPTLCDEFESIIRFLSPKINEIVIYTNGTNNLIPFFPNTNWIVSIYGLEPTHSYLSGNHKAFPLVKKNLVNIQKPNQNNVTLKIILNDRISNAELFSILDFAKTLGIRKIHVSCLNDRIHDSKWRYYTCIKHKDFLSTLIVSDFYVKLSNIPICFDTSFFEIINSFPIVEGECFSEYFIVKKAGAQKINYDSLHYWYTYCINCKLHSFCRDTNISYRILQIKNKTKSIVGE